VTQQWFQWYRWVLQHPSHSPDLAHSVFHLFVPFRQQLLVQQFVNDDDDDVIAAMMTWL
jgi:hypothetical protein